MTPETSAPRRLDCPTLEIVRFARRVAREYGDVLSPTAITGLVNAGFGRSIPPDMLAAAIYGITWTECSEAPARTNPQVRAGIEAWAQTEERCRRWDAQAPDRLVIELPKEAGGAGTRGRRRREGLAADRLWQPEGSFSPLPLVRPGPLPWDPPYRAGNEMRPAGCAGLPGSPVCRMPGTLRMTERSEA